MNLGPTVNTEGSDMCPALLPDDETMAWFSDRENQTLGLTDIFWVYKIEPGVAP